MALGSKQYRYKLWKTRLGIVVVLGICLLLGMSVWERYTVEREMAARRAVVEAELAELQSRYQTLKDEVAYLKDEQSLEAEIRKRFDVAREGESVVILTGEAQAPAPATTSDFVEETVKPWWKFW